MANKLNKVVRGKQKPVPVKIVNDAPKSSPIAEDTKWRAQDAMRTLARAREIENDKALMKAVRAEATSEIKRLNNVCKK